jgi:hypothetical protein
MGDVGERVDDRDAAGGGQVEEVLMREEPGDDPVHVALQDPRHVLDALTPPQPDFGVLQCDRVASEALDAHVKGYPRAYRGLLEDERDRPAHQWGLTPAPRLDPAREVQDCVELARVELSDVGEVRTAQLPEGAGRHERHIN